MKLVLFIQSLGPGGAERVAATLASHWAERGWEVRLVTLEPVEADCYPLHPAVVRIALNRGRQSAGLLDAMVGNSQRIRALRRVLIRERPELALSMMSTSNVLLALASLGLRGVTRIGSERTYPPRVPLGRSWEWLRRHTYGWLDAVVAVTSESREWVLAHTSARRVAVIPNPVRWPLPAAEPTRAPGSVGTRGRRRLLAVGRLGEEKRYDRLIETFARLGADAANWELMIVGEGPERPALQARIDALGLGGIAVLPGQVGNIGDWYASADLFVLTSRFEGFPNALVEAMAYGVPAVSVDCDTGPRDIIRHEVDGLLVPAGDDPALGAALARLMGDAPLRARFAARAVEVRDRFALARVSALWDELFRESSS